MITNQQLREIVALKKATIRRERGQFLIEGSLCVLEALKCEYPLEIVLLTQEIGESKYGESLRSRCADSQIPIEQIPARTLQRISSQENSQGVLAVGAIQEGPPTWENDNEDLLIVIPKLSDPGNLGTIMRTAHAFDIRTVWVGIGTVDPWHPKVVRGSMGSLFNLNIRSTNNISDELQALKRQDVRIIALDSDGHTPPDQVQISGRIALIFGHEAEGISQELLALTDDRIILGKPGAGVGSLNTAVAAAILIYLVRVRK